MNIIVIFAVLVLLIIIVASFRRNRLLKDKTVTPSQALEAWREGAFFVDVRTPEEYAETHVPGAILIPLKDLSARMGEIPTDRKIFVVCRSGSRSAKATITLIRHQFSNVFNVSGGMLSWKGPTQ
ncbi:MAG: rhodanese-like domain-containing protein [Negativicutes bacterium]|nr:rhodanese-like domain-containing protein [Negativicutes bacterium]